MKTYGNEPSDYQVDVEARIAERAIVKAAQDQPPVLPQRRSDRAAHRLAHRASRGHAGRACSRGTPSAMRTRLAALSQLQRGGHLGQADDDPGLLPEPLPPQDVADLQDHYRGRLGSLLAVDDLVERLVRTLKRTGEYRNTVIVFTSDNGWIMGEHRLRDPLTETGKAAGVKYLPFEASSRVPLLIAGGPFPRHKTVKGVVVNADLAPTILQLTGAQGHPPARRPVAARRRALSQVLAGAAC